MWQSYYEKKNKLNKEENVINEKNHEFNLK